MNGIKILLQFFKNLKIKIKKRELQYASQSLMMVECNFFFLKFFF
jgi:hypothetical protein